MAFLGSNQFPRVGLRHVCWFYYGNTHRLTETGFMEKPGIKLATPGLIADPVVVCSIAARSHTFVVTDHKIFSMVIHSRRVVVSYHGYKGKYVHKLKYWSACRGKSVVRLTDCLQMTGTFYHKPHHWRSSHCTFTHV